jgi:adenosylcobinamide-GDP ribazoletransferase
MTSARPAAADGLGAAYLAELTTSEAVVGVLGGCALTGVAIGVWLLPAAALAALTALAVRRLAYSKMGGISGDVLGATQQAAEIGVLLLASAVAMNDWIPLAWWR